jgi:transcription elongation factor Elf1
MGSKKYTPCPFCGSESSCWVKGGRYGRFTYVECDLCGARTKTFKYCGDEHAEVDWNDISVKKAWDAWKRRVNTEAETNAGEKH